MAQIKLTAGAQSKSWTLPQEDIQRILDSVKRQHGQVPDENSPPGMRDRTQKECFDIIADSFMSSLLNRTESSERNAVPIPPIDAVEEA